MRGLVSATVLSLFAAGAALADGYTPPTPTTGSNWTGFYIGGGGTTTMRTTTHTEMDPDGYDRQCGLGTSGSTHNNNKCVVSADDYANSPEIQALREVDSPWGRNGLRADGRPGEIVRYDNAGYHGIWMNDNASFSFSSDYGGAGPSTPRKPATNTMIAERFIETLTFGEDEEATWTAHARYLHDFGKLVGGLEVGTVGGNGAYAEVQLGADFNRVLPYVGVGTDHQAVGLDVALGEQRRLLLGGRLVRENSGYERPEVRVSWRLWEG